MQITNEDQIKKLIQAGNATFTLLNPRTENRVTFNIKRLKDEKKTNIDAPDLYFVSVFTGTENDNGDHYSYFGTLREAMGRLYFRYTPRSAKINESDTGCRVMTWFIEALNNYQFIQTKVEFLHESKCMRCGRKLTTPESIKSGLGPECAKNI